MSRNEHILIIGAGFAGIGLAHRLEAAGIGDYTILERADRVGGTWRDNTYPGLACDIPSPLYSYSFAPNPDWSRFFAPQAEILRYLEGCADTLGVRAPIIHRVAGESVKRPANSGSSGDWRPQACPSHVEDDSRWRSPKAHADPRSQPRAGEICGRGHLRLGVAATGATFDEASGLWTVSTSDGDTITARVLVSGAGHALTRPIVPDIPGASSFAGKVMHSARWDHTYPLEGKSVAVVGTGASAVQIVPAIADRVGRLAVFQRTAAWVLPKPDRATTAAERWLYRKAPWTQRLVRTLTYAAFESFALGHVFAPGLNKLHDWRGDRFLRRTVADPALRRKLRPTFRFGCKRILLSNEYYPTLQRDHVELVTDPIRAIRPGSIVTADGTERPVDVIVYATGFVAAEAIPPFPIRGRDGRTLGDRWTRGGEAYLGTTVSGFPNLFLMIGPNLGLGHNSMIFMMESQFRYVLGAISALRDRRLRFVDVRPEVQTRYNVWVQRRLARSVWNTGGCRSWYLTRDGKNTTIWPGFTFEYRARTRRFDIERYERGG